MRARNRLNYVLIAHKLKRKLASGFIQLLLSIQKVLVLTQLPVSYRHEEGALPVA